MTGMRLPLPGPRDVLELFERGASSVEQLLAVVPRVVTLVGDAETLLRRVERLVGDIEDTQDKARAVVGRAGNVTDRANGMVGDVEPLVRRLGGLLDTLEPSLTRLAPVIERLADTTDPDEVEALVRVVDHLPVLATRLETDVLPILDSLGSVAPDLHDLLGVSRELNMMLAQVPGISRMKRKVDEQQAAAARE